MYMHIYIYIHMYISKCKLDICVTEDVNYGWSIYLHREGIAYLVSDYIHVLYISTHIQAGEIPSSYHHLRAIILSTHVCHPRYVV